MREKDQMMKSEKEKKINKLIKGHGWFSLIMFLLFSLIASLLLADAVFTVGYYLLQTKIASEYESTSYMARIYDLSLKGEDPESVWEILDEEGSEYIIRDNEGRLVHGNRDNTCFKKGSITHIANVEGPVEIYPDNANTYIWVDGDGDIKMNIWGLVSLITKDADDIDDDILILNEDAAGTDSSFFGGFAISYSTDLQIRLPMWLGFDVNEGTEKFIGKGYVSIMLADLVIIVMALFGVALLLLFIFILFFANMIGNIRNRKRVRKVMFRDLATDGHNQTWFTYYGEKKLRSGATKKNSYAVVDLHIVKYNSFCMCHSVSDGEEILRRISKCIKKQIKGVGVYAYASSGEFHLLLKANDQERLITRLRTLISELEKVENVHAFTYHLGVSMIPPFKKPNGRIVKRKWVDLEQECNNAATARKTIDGHDGSDIAFFDVKLIEERKWHDLVEENCRAALEHEDFVVFYQPKYDPVTGLLKGAEALIRWRSSNPELAELGTLVPPGKFIPIFEQNGFITEIDHYMLKHVAADQKRWIDQGFECVPVSVNVSRAHFIEPDLAEQIRDAVDGAGAPRNLIEIELTESAFFDDKNALVRTIDKLKEYGFAVSMDDFGSGYSSLNSLKDMPLDVLKLDAEFFRGENAGERGKIVVSETIKLARSLNMRTVAEGVEAKEQVDFLANQGCDMIQGFYFEKPMPGSDYEVMMRRRVSDKPAAGVHADVTAAEAEEPANYPVENNASTIDGNASSENIPAESVATGTAMTDFVMSEGGMATDEITDSIMIENSVTAQTVAESAMSESVVAEGVEQESVIPESTAEEGTEQ